MDAEPFSDGAITHWPVVRADLLRVYAVNMELREQIEYAGRLFDTAQSERERAEAELAALKDQYRGLLTGTTEDGRPYGLHGTPESVAAVSDELAELAALKARVAEAEIGNVRESPDGAGTIATIHPSKVGKRVRLVVED